MSARFDWFRRWRVGCTQISTGCVRLGFVGTMLLALAACAGVGGLDAGDLRASPPVLQLTKDGVAGIDRESRVTIKHLTPHLPGFELTRVKAIDGGRLAWWIAAFKDALQQLQFEPRRNGKVDKIHIVGYMVAGPDGQRVGMRYDQWSGGRLSCREGRGFQAGMALCRDSTGVISYVFARAGSTAITSGKVAADALLTRMTWYAEGAG